MDLAIRRAAVSPCRHKMGAVLASGRRVLGAHYNVQRNSPVIDFQNATFHAEEAVLRRVRNPSGAIAYVARVNASGIPMLARPCPRCQKILADAGVAGAYYTTSSDAIEYMAIGR
ncbi:hypothetical protein [Streptomyces sp. NRRL F-2664]|uniref:hypothetical protein n=1 Tax=Streptomyces sp. NRRL F-2664 TaxID=1463842 RepID=UPI003B6341C0